MHPRARQPRQAVAEIVQPLPQPAQRRRKIGFREEQSFADAAIVERMGEFRDRFLAQARRLEQPCRRGQLRARAVVAARQRAGGEHIEQHGPQRLAAQRVEMRRQCPKPDLFAAGEDQLLIRVEHQHPMPAPIGIEHRIGPGDAEARRGVVAFGQDHMRACPFRHGARGIGGAVVQHDDAIDAEPSRGGQRVGQAQRLVPRDDHRQHLAPAGHDGAAARGQAGWQAGGHRAADGHHGPRRLPRMVPGFHARAALRSPLPHPNAMLRRRFHVVARDRSRIDIGRTRRATRLRERVPAGFVHASTACRRNARGGRPRSRAKATTA